MKARIPRGAGAPGNINAIMKQAQEMQENVAALQADLDQREYTATAADGMVSVTVTGKHQVKSLTIKPEMVDPEDMEMLEDMIAVAVNDAMRQVDETAEKEMGEVTGGLNIPGLV